MDRHGKLVPWLAERWYTTDSKNYTFFLRKGVRFHNGREMKAADVKYVVRPRRQPRDQASLPRTVRGDPGRHRQGRLHDQRQPEGAGRDVPLDGGAPGLGDLSEGSGGDPQDASRWAPGPSRCPTGCAVTASCS